MTGVGGKAGRIGLMAFWGGVVKAGLSLVRLLIIVRKGE